jgi:peptidoglycan/xylan/chitin deacetylase (PgdA/CDA1 family)
MYHGIEEEPGQLAVPIRDKYWVPVAQFREQLERMRRGRFRVARLREFAGSGDAPGAGESVVGLTFDDGRVSDYETAYPLLRELGWEADFFVNTATVGSKGFLSWSQIAEMHRGGMSIQSHGHDHVAWCLFRRRSFRGSCENPRPASRIGWESGWNTWPCRTVS